MLDKAAFHFADYSVDAVVEDIQSNEASLWGLFDYEEGLLGAVVTRVLEYPTGYVVWIVELAATVDNRAVPKEDWQRVMSEFELMAALLSCDAVRIVGRKGWGRAFPDFKEVERLYEKRIGEVH